MRKNVYDANPKLLGVRFGKFCIDNEIPVSKVANTLRVSRMTVYNWFTGVTKPSDKSVAEISSWLGKTK